MAVINKNGGVMNLPLSIARTNPIPVDSTMVWYDLELMQAYATSGATAYVGQILTLVNETENTAKAYVIADAAGTLNEVGSATLGDGASIELTEGILSVKDFGKRYYKYIEAVDGGEAAHYELVTVDETNQWAAGLEPRVVSENEELVIGWYEPNPTTVDGVKDQVTEVQGSVTEVKTEVNEVKTEVNTLDEILNGTTDNPGGLVGEVNDITDVLYGTDGENPVPGLIEDVDALAATLENNYYTKEQTYDRETIDGKLTGLFHFKGTADSETALPTEGNLEGDVYQVGEEEFAWNGAEWVKLGYTVDLSNYYTKEGVDAEVKKVQDALDLAEADIAENAGLIADNANAITALKTADTEIGTRIDGVDEKIAALETADTEIRADIEALETTDAGFVTRFETIEGNIAGLPALITKVGTLEGYVGTPSEGSNLGALYPAVESLNTRLNNIVAQGGEPNQINGISINGTALVPNDALIVELPIFAGDTAGLVPVISANAQANPTNYLLNAAGAWVNPFGDLGDKTVKEYVDGAIADVAILWDAI